MTLVKANIVYVTLLYTLWRTVVALNLFCSNRLQLPAIVMMLKIDDDPIDGGRVVIASLVFYFGVIEVDQKI
jgi:hypothetical protein